MILKSNAQDYTLAVSEATSSAFEGNDLRGVDTNTPVGDVVTSGTCYVLSGHSADNSVQGVGFYQYASTSTLQAHKAYVVIGETTGAPKRMRFVFDSTTDVENAESSDISVQKILRDGQLIIIRGDREFNVQGQIVK